jgi:hypothetical protein
VNNLSLLLRKSSVGKTDTNNGFNPVVKIPLEIFSFFGKLEVADPFLFNRIIGDKN